MKKSILKIFEKKKSTLRNIEKEINNNNPKRISSFVFGKEILEFDPSFYPLITLLKSNLFTIEEVSNPKFTWFEDNVRIENFLQIFKTEWCTECCFKTYEEENEWKKAFLRNYGIKHLVDINKAFWFGINEKCNSCGKLIDPLFDIDKPSVRKTEGILQFLEDNKRIIKLKKNFSKKEFNDFLREGFEYGDSTKILFVSKDRFKYLTRKIFEPKLVKDINPTKCFGIKDVKYVVTAFGSINIIKELFLHSASMMCLIDLTCVKYVYLRNRDTFIRTHLQKGELQDIDPLNKEEEKKLLAMRKKLPHRHTFLTECGLGFYQPSNHLAVKFI